MATALFLPGSGTAWDAAERRARWLGRSGLTSLMLLARGYAVFLPNPRGSSGRGQAFARAVVGDMGGADRTDCLAGLDALVADGIADGDRLGVTGVSYGGYMAAWMITQDRRFAAAVPIAPMINFVTQHLLSNISAFVTRFLGGSIADMGSDYYRRSLLLHTTGVTTPTMTVCGALDRCTPPEEAEQFHAALVEQGVPARLLVYPHEGHGIRSLPAMLDCSAHTLSWLDHYLRPDSN